MSGSELGGGAPGSGAGMVVAKSAPVPPDGIQEHPPAPAAPAIGKDHPAGTNVPVEEGGPKFNATRLVRRGRGRPRKDRSEYTCKVDNCDVRMINPAIPKHLQVYRICLEHSRALSVVYQGKDQRYCQTCRKLQPAENFEKFTSSCRVALNIHKERRRNLRNRQKGGGLVPIGLDLSLVPESEGGPPKKVGAVGGVGVSSSGSRAAGVAAGTGVSLSLTLEPTDLGVGGVPGQAAQAGGTMEGHQGILQQQAGPGHQMQGLPQNLMQGSALWPQGLLQMSMGGDGKAGIDPHGMLQGMGGVPGMFQAQQGLGDWVAGGGGGAQSMLQLAGLTGFLPQPAQPHAGGGGGAGDLLQQQQRIAEAAGALRLPLGGGGAGAGGMPGMPPAGLPSLGAAPLPAKAPDASAALAAAAQGGAAPIASSAPAATSAAGVGGGSQADASKAQPGVNVGAPAGGHSAMLLELGQRYREAVLHAQQMQQASAAPPAAAPAAQSPMHALPAALMAQAAQGMQPAGGAGQYPQIEWAAAQQQLVHAQGAAAAQFAGVLGPAALSQSLAAGIAPPGAPMIATTGAGMTGAGEAGAASSAAAAAAQQLAAAPVPGADGAPANLMANYMQAMQHHAQAMFGAGLLAGSAPAAAPGSSGPGPGGV